MMQAHRARDSRAAVRMPAMLRDLVTGALRGADHRGDSADINPPLTDGDRAKIEFRRDAMVSLLSRVAPTDGKGPSAGDSEGARGYPVVEAE